MPTSSRVRRPVGTVSALGRPSRADLAPALHALAATQGGALTRPQLGRLGISDDESYGHVLARRWQVPIPGIFATFTGALPRATRLWVAVLHVGDEALLSHETAAETYGQRQVQPGGQVHVLAPHGRKIVVPSWITLHRTRLLQWERANRPAGLPPVTCIVDTVLDLVDQSRWELQAIHWVMGACQARLTTPEKLLYAMGRRRRIKHRRLVKEVCADVDAGATTPLERAYLHSVERPHGLPKRTRQGRDRVRGARIFRDVEYDAFRLVVELDGRLGHEGEANAFRDRRRDNATVVGGRTSLRFGWTDVKTAPCEVAAEVATVLRQNGWTGTPTPCSATCPVAAATG